MPTVPAGAGDLLPPKAPHPGLAALPLLPQSSFVVIKTSWCPECTFGVLAFRRTAGVKRSVPSVCACVTAVPSPGDEMRGAPRAEARRWARALPGHRGGGGDQLGPGGREEEKEGYTFA